MPRTTCPACGRGFILDEDEALLYSRVYCPHCDAPLDVIEENPLMVEEAEE